MIIIVVVVAVVVLLLLVVVLLLGDNTIGGGGPLTRNTGTYIHIDGFFHFPCHAEFLVIWKVFYSYGGPQLEAGAAEIRLGSGPAALLISSNVPAGAVLWDRRGCKCFVLQKVYIYI